MIMDGYKLVFPCASTHATLTVINHACLPHRTARQMSFNKPVRNSLETASFSLCATADISADSTSDTGSMLAKSISLIRPVIRCWRLSEHERCGPTQKELSVRCCWRVGTVRTWTISLLIHPPTHASGLAVMTGSGDE